MYGLVVPCVDACGSNSVGHLVVFSFVLFFLVAAPKPYVAVLFPQASRLSHCSIKHQPLHHHAVRCVARLACTNIHIFLNLRNLLNIFHLTAVFFIELEKAERDTN